MAKIAIVDDSFPMLKLLDLILKGENHSVWTYKQTDNLENQLASLLPDLLLLDINMPYRNGYDILLSLKKHPQLKYIPVIYVSAKDEESDVKWGLRQGAVAYITKPFTTQDVISTISPFLQGLELRNKKLAIVDLFVKTYGEIANRILPKLNDCQTEKEVFDHVRKVCNSITIYEDINKSKTDAFMDKVQKILENEVLLAQEKTLMN